MTTTDAGADLAPGYECAHCTACGFNNFPPSAVCPACLAEAVELRPLSREGTLYSFTSLRVGETTMFVGYVDLPEGVRVFGRIEKLTPGERPVCGMAVHQHALRAPGSGPAFAFVPADGERSHG